MPLLRTLVLCDLADSTALVERLGDREAAELFRIHDRRTRVLVHEFGGREIDKTDGFLLMFERPIQAVAFALAYQRSLGEIDTGAAPRLKARVGIHVGDVVTWGNTPDDVAKGAKPVEVEGLVKPITSRLMQLALPGQILLSGVAYQLAHRSQGELGDAAATALWRTHGRYRFKGLPDPIAVFEVGEEGTAPLKAPPWSGKAHREVPFWRRPATLAIEIVAILALIALPIVYLLRPEPAIAFAKRDWVVVGDLKNLTGDASFDDSVTAAFRIGLEQSRYVNVLPSLKTRETVKLMQRDPDQTVVDRAVGSEVAIRDGARALVLPTIAEIGGRVRVTAEVIDPKTQTTVYSESADGVGEESVLTSLDKVSRELRVRLGEALATVSSESAPLDKVATKNLDALRAYSLGVRAYNTGRHKESIALFDQALKLDPDFALAHIALSRAFLTTNQSDAARAEVAKAVQLRERLSSRDALYVDASQASFGPHAAALEKWKALAELYPDFFAANGTYAFFAWQWANRYDDAIGALHKTATSFNPNRGTSDYLLGVVYLAKERYKDSEASFDRAESADAESRNEFHSFVFAAQRQFKRAADTLDRGRSTGISSADVLVGITRATFAADQGDLEKATRTLADARRESGPKGSERADQFRLPELTLAALAEPSDRVAAELHAYVLSLLAALKRADGSERTNTIFHALVAAYVCASLGESASVDAVLAADIPELRGSGYPLLTQMIAIAKAERARAHGDSETAVKLIEPLLDGSELYIAHLALLDAYSALGQDSSALEQARWLAGHRGRAYAEYADRVLTPFNVAQSDLALLRAAEISSTLGKKNDARDFLAKFRGAWPNAEKNPALSARLAKLEKPLGK